MKFARILSGNNHNGAQHPSNCNKPTTYKQIYSTMKTTAQIGDLIHLKLNNKSGVAIAVTPKQVTVKIADDSITYVLNNTKYLTVIS